MNFTQILKRLCNSYIVQQLLVILFAATLYEINEICYGHNRIALSGHTKDSEPDIDIDRIIAWIGDEYVYAWWVGPCFWRYWKKKDFEIIQYRHESPYSVVTKLTSFAPSKKYVFTPKTRITMQEKKTDANEITISYLTQEQGIADLENPIVLRIRHVSDEALAYFTKLDFKQRLEATIRKIKKSGPIETNGQKFNYMGFVSDRIGINIDEAKKTMKYVKPFLNIKPMPHYDFIRHYPKHRNFDNHQWLLSQIFIAAESLKRPFVYYWFRSYQIDQKHSGPIMFSLNNVDPLECFALFLWSIEIQKRSAFQKENLNDFEEHLPAHSHKPMMEYRDAEQEFKEEWSMDKNDVRQWIWTADVTDSQKHPFIFRAIYVPTRDFDINKLKYPSAGIQSFTHSASGFVDPLCVAHEIAKGALGGRILEATHEIVIMMAPIQLIPWSKMHPPTFAYSFADDHVPPFSEKELVLSSFPSFDFVKMNNDRIKKALGGNRFARVVSADDLLQIELISEQAFANWNSVSGESLKVNAADIAKHVKLATNAALDANAETEENFAISFGFFDMHETYIEDYQYWIDALDA